MGGVFTHRVGAFNPAAGGGSQSVAVATFAQPTAVDEEVDITTAALGGETPVGALFLGNLHADSNAPSGTGNMSFGIGAFDGTRVAFTGATSQTALTATKDRCHQGHDAAATAHTSPLRLFDPNGTNSIIRLNANGTGNGFLSNGVGVKNDSATFAVPDGVSRTGAAVFFAGTGAQAYCGEIALGTGTSAIDVTDPGFEPDIVFFFGNCRAADAVAVVFMYLSFGIALNDGTQRAVFWSENDTVGAGQPWMSIRDDVAGGQALATDGTITYTLTVSTFDASGFSVTPSANAGSDSVQYLAIKLPTGKQASLFSFDSPTVTGNQTYTNPGFEPEFALAVLTSLETYNAAGVNSDLSGGLGIGLMSNVSRAFGWRINHGADPTDTAQINKDAALLGPIATGPIGSAPTEGSLVGFTSTGLTLNYSAVQGTAKKGFMLAIG